jgi:RNA-directed DNA polymerase
VSRAYFENDTLVSMPRLPGRKTQALVAFGLRAAGGEGRLPPSVSVGATFEQMTAFENLHAAAWQVLKGKRGKLHANRLFYGIERRLLALQASLRDGSYRPGPYQTFWIRDPKPRLISAPPLIDRVVHHAVVRVIEPRFERRFIAHSYACRRGKGQHRALSKFVPWARAHRYVLLLDVHRFFPSVDHEVLKAELRRAVGDRDALWLLDTIIDGSNRQEPVTRWYPGDSLLSPVERRRGLPIGNLTSQFFGNVMLDRVDHLVKDRLRVKRYLRYADDMALFHDDAEVLRDARSAIVEELSAMRLSLNEGKSRLRRVKEGIRFLGFVVTPSDIRLAQPAVRRARVRGRALTRGYAAGILRLEDVRASWRGWCAHVEHGRTQGLVRAVAEARVFTCNRAVARSDSATCAEPRP